MFVYYESLKRELKTKDLLNFSSTFADLPVILAKLAKYEDQASISSGFGFSAPPSLFCRNLTRMETVFSLDFFTTARGLLWRI